MIALNCVAALGTGGLVGVGAAALLAGAISLCALVVVALATVRVVRLALEGTDPPDRPAALRAAADVVRALRGGRHSGHARRGGR